MAYPTSYRFYSSMISKTFDVTLPDYRKGDYFRQSQAVALWMLGKDLWVNRKSLESYLGKPVDAAREQLKESNEAFYVSAHTVPLLGIVGGTDADYSCLFQCGSLLEIIRQQILSGSSKYFRPTEDTRE